MLRSWAMHGLVVAGAAGAVALDRRIRRTRIGAALGGGAADAPNGFSVAPFVIAGAYHALVWAMEARHPHDETWRPPRSEVVTDAAFIAASLVASTAGMAGAAALASRLGLDGNGAGRVGALPARLGDTLGTAVGATLAILGYDAVHTRMHHLGHIWGPGWLLHSVHHSPSRLYWFNATRFHVAEMLIDGALEGTVLALLGLSRDQHIAYQTMRITYGQLQHSNIALHSGVLDRIFATPDLHRWHHSTNYTEGDTNYGAIISIWDQAFGTFFRPADRESPDALGIGRMPEFPTNFVELQRVPFDWASIRERNAATWYAADATPEPAASAPAEPVAPHP